MTDDKKDRSMSDRTRYLLAAVLICSALLIGVVAPVKADLSGVVALGITSNEANIFDLSGVPVDGVSLNPPVLTPTGSSLTDVAISNDPTKAVVVQRTGSALSPGGRAYVVNMNSGTYVSYSSLGIGTNQVAVTFSGDGAAVGNADGYKVKIVDLRNPLTLPLPLDLMVKKSGSPTPVSSDKARAVGFTRDERLLVGVYGTGGVSNPSYLNVYEPPNDPGTPPQLQKTVTLSGVSAKWLAIAPLGNFAVISGPESNNVAIVDLDSDESDVVAAPSPGEPDITADGRYALVPNTLSDTVTVIDLASAEVLSTIPVVSTSWNIGSARSVAVVNENEALVAGSGGVAKIVGLSSLPDTLQDGIEQVSSDAIDHIAITPWVEPFTPVSNQPPTIDPVQDVTVKEGEPVTIPVSGSDPDNDPLAYVASGLPGGALFDENSGLFTWTPSFGQAGNYEVTFSVTDDDGASASATVSITVIDGQAPTIMSTSPNPLAVGTPVIITAQASDEATDGSAIASAAYTLGDWENAVRIDDISTDGSLSFQLSGLAAGVYHVNISATDEYGNVGYLPEPLIVVVYDPTGGFVTGGGWIDSAQGKATFGFVAKYQKGMAYPKGETTLNVNEAGIKFLSDSYQYLVVNGETAEVRGTGTVNGEPGYVMTLKTVDNGKTDALSFRLAAPDGTVVFETGEPLALGGGSIVVHGSK